MISKELLSIVLGIPLLHIRYNDTTNLYEIFKEDLFNWSDGSYGRWSNLEVNIYELAHKCKEWAYNQGYSYLGNNKLCNIHSKDGTIIALTNNNISKWYDINIDFIACQWILDKELA